MSRLRQSHTSEEKWEDPGLINGSVAHPFKLIFWEEDNGPVTPGIGLLFPFFVSILPSTSSPMFLSSCSGSLRAYLF